MSITANEQLLVELINRARLDPLAEAARFGIDLNDSLPKGEIDGKPKQALAVNASLDKSAEGHSKWMLDADVFSHDGHGGSSSGDRMRAAGYEFEGAWRSGENIAFAGSTGGINLTDKIFEHNEGLFLSAGHRENTLDADFKELGVAQVQGMFSQGGKTYTSSMLTENFAKQGDANFLTGVAYKDRNHNSFYDVDEASSGVSFRIGAASVKTAVAGGYAFEVAAKGEALVEITSAGRKMTATVDFADGNVKLDLVDGKLLLASSDLALGHGVANGGLLGSGDLDLTGSSKHNVLTGNRGANEIVGLGGNDKLRGMGGNDTLIGGQGNDLLDGGTGSDLAVYTGSAGVKVSLAIKGSQNTGQGHDTLVSIERLTGTSGNDMLTGSAGKNTLTGGNGSDRLFGLGGNDALFGGKGNDTVNGGGGNDRLFGGPGNDRLVGGAGNDRLSGEAGNDVMIGGAGRDTFVFNAGRDKVMDFSLKTDRLLLDDDLWSGDLSAAGVVKSFAQVTSAGVVLDFHDGDVLTIANLHSTAGLAGLIDFF